MWRLAMGWRWAGVVLLSASIFYAPPAPADDVKMERGANGGLHISITGEKPPTPPTVPDDQPAEQGDAAERLSVQLSLKRKDIERKLNAAAGRVQETREEIRATQAQRVDAQIGTFGNEAAARDTMAWALRYTQQFEEQKRLNLDALRAKEREQLRALSALYAEWDDLRAAVRRLYGQPPAWWADTLNCPACPSPEEITRALQ